jgi:hypothetical protein
MSRLNDSRSEAINRDAWAVDGAFAYRKCVPDAEVHILDGGHFALDECLDEIALLIRSFFDAHLSPLICSPEIGNLFSTSEGE